MYTEDNNYEQKPIKNRSYPSYMIVALISAIIGGLLTSVVSPKIVGKNNPESYLGRNQEINITPNDELT